MIEVEWSWMVLMEVGVSLRPRRWDVVPVETVRVTRAVFPDGCPAVRLRDVLGPIFTDAEFAQAFSGRGQPAVSPALLALVSVLQFSEGLTARRAAQAVRARIDWKYALGLELTDPGFDFSVLSEFRSRLIAGGLEYRVLDAVLEAARRTGLMEGGGRARTDSTQVLAAVRGDGGAALLDEDDLALAPVVSADVLVCSSGGHVRVWCGRTRPR